MKNISIALLFLLLLSIMGIFVNIPLASPDNAHAATVYYVNGAAGNDAWPGTSTGSPFATIDHAASTATTAGDYVWVMAGTYNEHVTIDGAGTAGNPITFQNYNNQKVVVYGNGIGASYGDGGIYIDNTDYITIDGLQTYDWGNVPGNTGVGICIRDGADNVIIQNTYSGSIGGSGIWCYNIDDVTLFNNECDKVNSQAGQEGITLIAVTGFSVTYNYVHDQPGAYTDAWCTNCPKEGIDAKVNCSSGTIAYNTVDGSRTGIYVDSRTAAHDIAIFNNIVSNCRDNSIAIDCELGGGLSNIYIYNNITFGAGYSEMRIGSSATSYDHIYILNNSFYESDDYIFWIREPGGNITNLYVENNIFAGTNGNGVMFDSGYSSSQHHFNNNSYAVSPFYGSDYQVGWSNMTNPPYDFSLLASSHAIDNGKTPTINVSTDYAGTVRPQDGYYDIGAYEYSTIPTGDQITNLTDSSDSTYVYHPGGLTLTHIGKYKIDTSGLGSGNVGTVTAHYRGGIGTPTGAAYLTPNVYLSGNSTIGTKRTLGTTITAYSDVLAHPNSGTWTVSNLGIAEFWLTMEHSISNWSNGARCTQLYITVDFIGSSGSLSEISRTIVAGVELPVICTYDGATQAICTGGTTSQALAGALYTNSNPVHVAEFNGLINDTRILDAGVEVLNLQYEPEDCFDTMISDHSASSNDVNYVLTTMDSCLDDSYSAIDFTGQQNVLSPDSNPQSAVGSIDPQLGTNPPSVPEENPDNILWVISDALADTTGTMSSDGEPRIPITLIATFIYFGALIWVWKKLSMYVRDRFILGMGTMVVTGAFVAMSGGLIHWGLLVFHAIIVLWMFVSERNQQV